MKERLRWGVVSAAIGLMLATTSYAFDIPVLKGRVNDYAELLTEPEEQVLEGILKDLEDRTTAQVVILTVPNTQNVEIADYAVKVAHAWEIGQADKDNGIVFVYESEGDHSSFQVGYGLEGAIPDAVAGDIIRNQFRAHAPKSGPKNFNAAFTAVAQKASEIISAEYAADPTGQSLRGGGGGSIDPFVIALVVVGILGLVGGLMDLTIGVVLGVLAGLVGGVLLSAGPWGFVALVVVGVVAGLIGYALATADLGGGYSVSSSGWGTYSGGGGGSSSGSSGGFSGGGGDFGGGGASD